MGYHFSSQLKATLNLCLIYTKITWGISTLSKHIHKKFKANRTNIQELSIENKNCTSRFLALFTSREEIGLRFPIYSHYLLLFCWLDLVSTLLPADTHHFSKLKWKFLSVSSLAHASIDYFFLLPGTLKNLLA